MSKINISETQMLYLSFFLHAKIFAPDPVYLMQSFGEMQLEIRFDVCIDKLAPPSRL
jgi:hypothetical protein